MNKIIQGDCLEELKKLPDNSIDAIVTDPPYGLEFMGKKWDRLGDYGQAKSKKPIPAESGQEFGKRIGRVSFNATQNVRCIKCRHWKFSGTPCKCKSPNFPNIRLKQAEAMEKFHYVWATECLRVLKPGGHLLSFGGTRTYHRMACAIEDAGFEIRDMIEWVYASGFPKSLNIGKAIKAIQLTGGSSPKNLRKSRMDKYYEPTGQKDYRKGRMFSSEIKNDNIKEIIDNNWKGFGTTLKPAHEPIVLARKPLSEKTIAENVLKHGTGGLDIDGTRIPIKKGDEPHGGYGDEVIGYGPFDNKKGAKWKESPTVELGRFPANVIVQDDALNDGKLTKSQGHWSKTKTIGFGEFGNGKSEYFGVGEKDNSYGSKSRYFDIDLWAEKNGILQIPKASKSERNMGCEELEEKEEIYPGINTFDENGNRLRKDGSIIPPLKSKNNHPTVKPIALMSWLIKLISKENDIVLDPFAGSGTTLVAAKMLNRKYIGIEKETEYVKIAEARLKSVPI